MPQETEFLTNNKKSFYLVFGKRFMDIVISFLVIVALLPVLLIIAVLIKLDSEGPVIYKQKRVCKGATEFCVYKFRTMIVNADKIGPSSTEDGDKRITKIGETLRRFSLDELPQLFNVLRGEMSLVGYRPGVAEDYTSDELNSDIFKLKPGITGYAQINGRSSLTLEEKRNWELRYVKEVSMKTDLKILIKTVGVVLKRDGVN
jgi:lipopolysaccharide/colanic/teichoic acid biosynthesis glycosyltransferase